MGFGTVSTPVGLAREATHRARVDDDGDLERGRGFGRKRR